MKKVIQFSQTPFNFPELLSTTENLLPVVLTVTNSFEFLLIPFNCSKLFLTVANSHSYTVISNITVNRFSINKMIVNPSKFQ